MRRRRAALLAAAASLLTLATVVPSGSPAAGPGGAAGPPSQHAVSRPASATCTDLPPPSVPTLQPQWFLPTPGEVTAEPAIAWGHAFVGDGTGVMHAVDMATGKDAWTFDVTHNR